MKDTQPVAVLLAGARATREDDSMRGRSIMGSLLIAIALYAAAGCGAGVGEADGQGLAPPEAPTDGGPMAEELDPLVEGLFALDLSPGLAVAVVRDGEVVYLRGFGYADVEKGRRVDPAETLFYIASTSKSFTGLTTALLAHEGVLELDAPLGRYIPDLAFESPALSADEISIRELLTMTDGTGQYGPFIFRTAYTGEFTEEKLIELLARTDPANPGRFAYRNQPYNILGIVIERATGMGWKEVFERRIAAPLGLEDTSPWMSRVDRSDLAMPYAVTPGGFERRPLTKNDANMHAAGGHVTTVLDLARWIEAFLQDGVVDGERVFPPEVIEAARTAQVPQDRDFSLFHRHGWGHGWDIGTYDGDTLVHRFGGYTGAYSHVSFMPEHGIGVVALANEPALGDRVADGAAAAIYDHLLGKEDAAGRRTAFAEESRGVAERYRRGIADALETRAARQRPMPLPLSAYAGTYENDQLGTMTWTETDDGLEAHAGLVHAPAEAYEAGEHAFRVALTGGGSVVRFLVEDGEVVGLTYRGFEFARTGG